MTTTLRQWDPVISLTYAVILATLLLLLLPACDKTSPPVSINPENEFRLEDFPVEVGSWWSYKVTDFLGGTEDTLIIKVVEKQSKTDEIVYKCSLEQDSMMVDSAVISISTTHLAYMGLYQNYSYFGDWYFDFPLDVGDMFGNSTLDSVSVISFTEDKTIEGNSYDVFFLRREATSPGFSIVQTLSISREIGIVEQTYNLFNTFPVQKQNFRLIDYNVD